MLFFTLSFTQIGEAQVELGIKHADNFLVKAHQISHI